MADDLQDSHILVTSGPTRGNIDAVRYISNRSSGWLGARIALEALSRGARVTLIAGPSSVTPQRRELTAEEADRLRIVDIETVDDLTHRLQEELTREPPDAVIHAMAVLDYVPAAPVEDKTPSGRDEWTVRLVKTPKVIRRIRDWAPHTCLVAFKLEVGLNEEELTRQAMAVLRASNADFVVANDLTSIRNEAHPAILLDADGRAVAHPETKGEIARALCRLLAAKLSPG